MNTSNPWSMLCIFAPLSLAIIVMSTNFSDVAEQPNKRVEQVVYPENFSKLSDSEKNDIIKGHSYQSCVITLERGRGGYGLPSLSEEVRNTCNPILKLL
jgi:hypothetical protein